MNLIDFIPVICIKWHREKSGKVYLVKEKSKNKFIKKIIDLVGKRQEFHIYLDMLGSETWSLIDGKRTIHEISQIMKNKYGEELQQPETRVCTFFILMNKQGFTRFEVN